MPKKTDLTMCQRSSSKPRCRMAHMAAGTVEAAATEAKVKRTPEEEAACLRRTIFVGNLALLVKRRTLLKHFGRWEALW